MRALAPLLLALLLAPLTAHARFHHGTAGGGGGGCPAAPIGTPVLIGTATASSSASVSITTTASVPAGCAIVVIAGDQANRVSGYSDGTANSYTALTTNSAGSGNGIYVQGAYVCNSAALASGSTITLTITGGFEVVAAQAFYLPGAAASSCVDVQTAGSTIFSTSMNLTATGTLGFANEVVISAAEANSTSPTGWTWGGGSSMLNALVYTSTEQNVIGYHVVTSTASVTPTLSWTNNATISASSWTFH